MALLVVAANLQGCVSIEDPIAIIEGSTMGTTYQISYAAPASVPELESAIEAVLDDINASLSTYVDAALISQINAGRSVDQWYPLDPHFEVVFNRSLEVYRDTDGAFNPALGPLIEAWGFGPDAAERIPDGDLIDELLAISDFDAFVLRLDPPELSKGFPGAQLDFSAIAKGYAVDAVGLVMEDAGIDNYMVEIGGEVRTRGLHPSGRGWRVGIERPVDSATAAGGVHKVVSLTDAGLATSGNYRNYFEEDGRRYAHIIDPETGHPGASDLLSATVVAPDSMTADAYATAFMVMGAEEAIALVDSHDALEAYFILSDSDGGYLETWSDGFAALIVD